MEDCYSRDVALALKNFTRFCREVVDYEGVNRQALEKLEELNKEVQERPNCAHTQGRAWIVATRLVGDFADALDKTRQEVKAEIAQSYAELKEHTNFIDSYKLPEGKGWPVYTAARLDFHAAAQRELSEKVDSSRAVWLGTYFTARTLHTVLTQAVDQMDELILQSLSQEDAVHWPMETLEFNALVTSVLAFPSVFWSAAMHRHHHRIGFARTKKRAQEAYDAVQGHIKTLEAEDARAAAQAAVERAAKQAAAACAAQEAERKRLADEDDRESVRYVSNSGGYSSGHSSDSTSYSYQEDDDYSYSYHSNGPWVNPANGLPMMNAAQDIHGNVLGTDPF